MAPSHPYAVSGLGSGLCHQLSGYSGGTAQDLHLIPRLLFAPYELSVVLSFYSTPSSIPETSELRRKHFAAEEHIIAPLAAKQGNLFTVAATKTHSFPAQR
jgi:hypothetical protein